MFWINMSSQHSISEKSTLWKPLVCILRLTEGSFTFRELNEKILLYLNISKTECCVIVSNHHLILSFPHLSFNSSRGEKTAVPLIYSPTHLKSSVVDHKGKKDKYNSFQTSWRIGSKLQRKSGEKKKKDCHAPRPISNPAQIKMETGGVSPSGLVFFSRSTQLRRWRRKTAPRSRASCLLHFSTHAAEPTEAPPPGRPKAQQWF